MPQPIIAPASKSCFEMTFTPSIALISVLRRFVSAFYERTLLDADATSRLALATHELLENACKYSSTGETTLRIEVRDVRPSLSIRLSNRADPAHIADIEARFAEMDTYVDPFAYYQTLMQRAMRRRDGSGLGLARIRAEGDMSLSLEREGDLVSIIAETDIQAGAAAVERAS